MTTDNIASGLGTVINTQQVWLARQLYILMYSKGSKAQVEVFLRTLEQRCLRASEDSHVDSQAYTENEKKDWENSHISEN